MQKIDLLRKINFGKRVAEEETNELANYFVETDHWRRIFAGEIDIIYGAKGTGKSAIYALLQNRSLELLKQKIIISPAENPRGVPIFSNLVNNAPASDDEFRSLWKLYFVSLLGKALKDNDVNNENAYTVIKALEDANLLQPDNNLQQTLRSAMDYVKNLFKAESVSTELQLDPLTGQIVGVSGKISFREPSANMRKAGIISTDTLLEIIEKALIEANLKVWIILDRLDVAFADSHDLEKNALLALFRVYLDFLAHTHFSLKIFIRSDIWKRITDDGFREASHITRHITISWNKESLLNLIIKRALQNISLRRFYKVKEKAILNNVNAQKELFYRIFPKQVHVGAKQPSTLDWLLSRTIDGLGINAPRELIHLLSEINQQQIQRLENGNPNPDGENLFDPIAIRESLPNVSNVRLTQTIYSEYPQLKLYMQKLESQKTQHTTETLSEIWDVNVNEATKLATQLRDIGFFEKRESKKVVVYRIPFLYRNALNMVRGSAVEQDNE